ncbi:MAG: hypothetical protein C0424_12295 [Sphingobacteriaceae bacterium]|nr:hypothetical protein [Sphingobacteriaceae bacterium]
MRYFPLLLLVLFSAASTAQSLLDDLYRIRQKHQVPGISFAVVGPQTLLQSGADGYASLTDSSPLGLYSSMHLGSNSKALTSLVAQQMVQKGKINWNTTLEEIFPEWRKSMQKAYRKVTLADLLSHRGRLPAFMQGAEVGLWYGCTEGMACRYEFSRQLLQQEPLPKPRKNQFQYSNAGYVVAATMLERRGDSLSYENLLALYANQILGANFQAGWPRSSDRNQAAAGHFFTDSGYRMADERSYQLGPVYVPAGNLHGNVVEQAAVLQLFLQAYVHQANELSKQEAEHLLFGRPNYAFGWAHGLKNQQAYAWHDGSAGTFYTRWLIFPSQQKAIAISVNGAGEPAKKAIEELQKLLENNFGL